MDTGTVYWMLYVTLLALGAVTGLVWVLCKPSPSLTHENREEVAKGLYEHFLEKGT